MLRVFGMSLLALALGISAAWRKRPRNRLWRSSPARLWFLNQDGKEWKLAAATGKKAVLLYFYPKDETPGCTKEACGFARQHGDFAKSRRGSVGVSFDHAASHKILCEAQSEFSVDRRHRWQSADTYGVADGWTKAGATREFFFIGRMAKILHVTDSPNADRI